MATSEESPPNRYLRAADSLLSIHGEFAKAWVWGLTLLFVMVTIIVFNELALSGLVEQTVVEGLRLPLTLISGVGLFGMATYFSAIGLAVVGKLVAHRREGEEL
jgi:hypothetical protein